jgi:hypothetical protein
MALSKPWFDSSSYPGDIPQACFDLYQVTGDSKKNPSDSTRYVRECLPDPTT